MGKKVDSGLNPNAVTGSVILDKLLGYSILHFKIGIILLSLLEGSKKSLSNPYEVPGLFANSPITLLRLRHKWHNL